MARALALTLAVFALVFTVARARYAPPLPLPVDAPAERFSATRAREVQARVVGDGATRWVGTDGNARARAVISSELERLGWRVELQAAGACSPFGTCAPVTNLLAELAGREPDLPAVLLAAHVDSVPVSPGASDDGVGVAALLEAARALAAGPRPRRTVLLLFTDAEEAGLLGAEAFARAHPRAHDFVYAINVDARGSRGPSMMFEASADNRAVVSMMAASLERPVTTSLFFEAYRRMPNDTDFSVLKRHAVGLNFANLAGIESYHTPLDTMASADPGTLQHHGDHVLGMARAFAEADAPRVHGEAVWFDVLAIGIVRWPAEQSLGIALVALALVFGQWLRRRRADRGLAVFFVSLFAGLSAAAIMGWALRAAGALPAPWVAHPAPALSAVHVAGAAGAISIALFLARRARPESLWAGTWLGWGVIGALTAAAAPGASYLFVVPALAAGLAGFLPLASACVVPAAVASVLVFALGALLYEALGFAVPLAHAVPTVLLVTTLSPMLARISARAARRTAAALSAFALGLGLVAAAVPKFTASRPQRVNVVFRQDDGAARVFVDTSWGPARWGSPPAAMVRALGGPARLAPALPWGFAPVTYTDVPAIDAPAPSAEIVSIDQVSGRRRVRARLWSPRGAPSLALVLPAARPVDVRAFGQVVNARPVVGGSLVGLFAVPPSGALVELEARGDEPIAATLIDMTEGVPPGTAAAAVVSARPPEAAPFQDGDSTLMTSHVSF